MTALDDDRATLAGLRFARDSMSPQERRTLGLAEAMLRRIDAALAKIDEAERALGYLGRYAPENDRLDVVLTAAEIRDALGVVPAATRTR